MARRGNGQGGRSAGFCDPCWRQAYLYYRRAEQLVRMFSKSLYRGSLSSERDRTRHDVAPASVREASRGRMPRSVCFALLVGLTAAAFWTPLSALIRFSFQQEQYSHIILIPLVSVSLLFLARKRIFS